MSNADGLYGAKGLGHRPRDCGPAARRLRARPNARATPRSFSRTERGTGVRAASMLAIVTLASLVTLDPASAISPPFSHYCGRVNATPVTAFNLSCLSAARIWRASSGGRLPRGWTGANVDRAGGEALLFPSEDLRRVIHAESARSLDLRRLGSTPVVFARVPYGD